MALQFQQSGLQAHVNHVDSWRLQQEVKDIFHLLEADFNPLELCTKLAPLLEKLPALNAEVSSRSCTQQSCSMLHERHISCILAIRSLASISWVVTICVARLKLSTQR